MHLLALLDLLSQTQTYGFVGTKHFQNSIMTATVVLTLIIAQRKRKRGCIHWFQMSLVHLSGGFLDPKSNNRLFCCCWTACPLLI